MDIASFSNNRPVTAVSTQSPSQPADQDQWALIRAVRAINAGELFGHDNELTFVLDRATRRAVVRIVNRETHEVVQQIPAEYVLRLAEDLKAR